MPEDKHPGGRPPIWTDELIEKHADGLLSFARELGKTPFYLLTYAINNEFPAQYFSKWEKTNEKFCEALKMVKDIQERNLVEAMWDAKNPTGFIFTLKNVAEWRDSNSVQLSGPDGGPIKSEVIARGAQVDEIMKKLDPETRQKVLDAAGPDKE